jgi:membrane protein
MFRTFRIPLTWRELASRTVKEANADNVLGLAAQLSYYFLLALVPAIVCVVAIASFLPPQTIQDFVDSMRRVAPGDVIDIVREQLTALAGRGHEGVFTFGLLLALWSSSAAMVGMIDALNRAYDIEEGRPWWKVRLTAIGLTIGVAVLIVLAFGLLLVGPTLADQLTVVIGAGPMFATAWKILQWPLVFAMVVVGLGLIYYFAPDAEQDWEWITPGAVIGTVLWLVASLAFKLYATQFGNYNETYGSLGGAIVLMLWFYISGLAMLVGAELNAEIEHASPHGKAPGEKVPGERRKIGAAAARAFAARQSERGSVTPPEKAVQHDAPGPVAVAKPSLVAFVVVAFSVWRQLRRSS